MFDTHCHLNFSAFKDSLDDVIQNARNAGVKFIVIPGTDFETSKKAVEITEKYEEIYAAVGIHPHHIYEFKMKNEELRIEKEIANIENFLKHPRVVAVGEVGIDRHYYQKTKYSQYQIDEGFIELQEEFLRLQIQLAATYKKSLILHNREAKEDLLAILNTKYQILNTTHVVFHCCEPDQELLDFAIKHNIYIGVDGDVTYDPKKQEFIKKIPLELLVLETDSPFLKPQGTNFPNEPKNLSLIANYTAKLLKKEKEEIEKITTENAKELFQI